MLCRRTFLNIQCVLRRAKQGRKRVLLQLIAMASIAGSQNLVENLVKGALHWMRRLLSWMLYRKGKQASGKLQKSLKFKKRLQPSNQT